MAAAPAGRRRLDTTVPVDYDIPTRRPRLTDDRTAQLVIATVLGAWVVGSVLAATAVVKTPVPSWVERPAAGLLLVVFGIGLTHRAGGHMRIWATITGVLAIAAVGTQSTGLLSAAAATTAVLAAVLAVMITRPAYRPLTAMREYVISLSVALSGTVAVAAWNAPVNYQRFNLAVLAVALGLAIVMVWSLGAGLHGLGRQNLTLLVGVAVVLVVLLVYSSLVRSHGSQALVENLDDLVIWMRTTFEGVPRPVEVFIGFPALVVGVSLRSQRREGWWILVFAVLGTGVLTTSLVSPGAFPSYIAMSTLYSAVLGLGIGVVVTSFVVKPPSAKRARAVVPERRVEPARLAPLK